jgi:hypothetical protein
MLLQRELNNTGGKSKSSQQTDLSLLIKMKMAFDTVCGPHLNNCSSSSPAQRLKQQLFSEAPLPHASKNARPLLKDCLQ